MGTPLINRSEQGGLSVCSMGLCQVCVTCFMASAECHPWVLHIMERINICLTLHFLGTSHVPLFCHLLIGCYSNQLIVPRHTSLAAGLGDTPHVEIPHVPSHLVISVSSSLASRLSV